MSECVRSNVFSFQCEPNQQEGFHPISCSRATRDATPMRAPRITQHVGPILPPVRLKLNADVSSVITITRHMVLHALHVGDVYQ